MDEKLQENELYEIAFESLGSEIASDYPISGVYEAEGNE